MANRDRLLTDYPSALLDGSAALFVGAGISSSAGYPDWRQLLRDIGEELGVPVDDLADLAALAQWSIRKEGSRTRVQRVIDEEIGRDRPVPQSLKTLARLPLRHVWTTNYDRLIEHAFREAGRPYRVRAKPKDLSTRGEPGAALIYKMHGTIEEVSDVVIATDDYELYRQGRSAFLTLLQAQLTSMTFLFAGMSLTDPNVRHVLSLIRETLGDHPPEHYAIARKPHPRTGEDPTLFAARVRQHEYWADDLQRYGLKTVTVDEYSDIDDLLTEIARAVACKRMWISGSWPPFADAGRAGLEKVTAVAEGMGRAAAKSGLTLVTGSGLLVASSGLGGFLDELQRAGVWDLQRRLIARPFPQPSALSADYKTQWAALRREMGSLAGLVVFVGGAKADPDLRVAEGVWTEFEMARDAGAFLLPIGATGGAAAKIATTLIGSTIPSTGREARRPSDALLKSLFDPAKSAAELTALAAPLLTDRPNIT